MDVNFFAWVAGLGVASSECLMTNSKRNLTHRKRPSQHLAGESQWRFQLKQNRSGHFMLAWFWSSNEAVVFC